MTQRMSTNSRRNSQGHARRNSAHSQIHGHSRRNSWRNGLLCESVSQDLSAAFTDSATPFVECGGVKVLVEV
jgi:hypothetical protein